VAGYVPEETEWIPENAIYLDELEGGRAPVRAEGDRGDRAPVDMEEDAEESSRRARKTRRAAADKHDRYYLPAATVPAFSTSERPDARLATEDELRQFIDDVHPEDIDVESPEFRALPTEVQYEIIGDMRVKSRQQSHKRLTEMLAGAPTALDFSKAQIRHLSQRNALTQQLLTVTDMVGKAHLTIPVRVAAERNREYLLMKRGDGGGWALGIREGTAERPIELEPETKADRIKKEKDAAAATKAEVYSDDSESDIEE
jgi:DNA excision repair protein ERCC-5